MTLPNDVLEAVSVDTDSLVDTLDEHFDPEDEQELSDLYEEFMDELEAGIRETTEIIGEKWHYYNYDYDGYENNE